MQKLIVALLIALVAVPALAADEPKTDAPKAAATAEAPKADDKNTFYAIGLVVARQLAVFNLTPDEATLVKQGLTDGLAGGKTLVDADAYTKKIQDLAVARRDAEGQKLAAASKDYVEKAAKEKGAVKAPSGLIYIPVKEGKGESPKATDKVKVNYRGTLIDGKEFDSSYKRGTPAEFPLSGVIKCWTEGLQMMKPGGSAKLVCPPDLAYGNRGTGSIPANATLVFDVELLEIVK